MGLGYISAMTNIYRRRFLLAASSAALLAPLTRTAAQQLVADFPFTLGISSGYPQPDGVVLWTRLAPKPLEGGGMPPAAVEVAWEVASDDGFRQIVQRGKSIAEPQWGHSVHVEVAGLQPARWYFYRFHASGHTSPVGRTRTAPALSAAVDRMRFAIASCQQYEQGYYASWRHMAREDLDLCVHLGDYIYEATWGSRLVRSHGAPEPNTVEEYRNRYALYKTDVDLQAAHVAFPWLVTWDDHEVQNDYANDYSTLQIARDVFLTKRAAAYQAFYEHHPLPAWAKPKGPDLQLYTRWSYGQLAQFQVLDGRQYKDRQACLRPNGRTGVVTDQECPERMEPGRSYLGMTQERWLTDGLAESKTKWNVIAQQTMMAQCARPTKDGPRFWTDGWDGYPRSRERILNFIAEKKIANPVVLGGDIHNCVVADIKANFDDAASPVIASEFVGTSISSQGPSKNFTDGLMKLNPHVKYMDGVHRGYTSFELTPKQLTAHHRILDDVKDARSDIKTVNSWVVAEGRAGAQKV